MFSKNTLNKIAIAIAPIADTPLWRKAILRHLLMASLRAINKMPTLQRYSPHSIVPGWSGWYEWRGMCICFVDTEGGEHLRW